MTHSAFFIATGPCLIMLLGALAMLIVGSSLGSGVHAYLWSVSFVAFSLQWAFLSVTPNGPGLSWASVMASLSGLAGATLYVQGFRRRDAAILGSRAFVGLVLGTAALDVAAMLPREPFALLAIGRCLRGFLILTVAVGLLRAHRRSSVAEVATGIMLFCIVGVSLADVLVPWAAGSRPQAVIDSLPSLAMVAGPAGAALVLFTLLLVASDFSVTRRRLVQTDPLTGVLNRMGFDRAARDAARYRTAYSIVLADIDCFKAINDGHGHAAGDAALACFARCLASDVREGEAVGRIGGEEFALLLLDEGAVTFSRIERLRARIEALEIADQPGLRLTVSFGIAERIRGELPEGLVARADRALYAAKGAGRNRAVLAESA